MTRISTRISTWFGAAALMTISHAAQAAVLVVGSGQPFSQITTAVTAAQSGDTILVKSGNYVPFIVDGKGLTIVADQGASVFVGILGLLPQQSTVKNLPANRLVVVRGIDGPLLLIDNDGPVRIEECTIAGQRGDCSPLGCTWPTPAVDVKNCAPVAITRCSLEGGGGGAYLLPGFDLCTDGGPGLSITNSTVALHHSTLAGGVASGGCSNGVALDDVGGGLIDGLAPQHGFVATSPLRKAQLGALDFSGLPGDTTLLLIAPSTDFLPALQYQGVLLAGPSVAVAVLGPLPSSGLMSLPLFVGDLPPAGVAALDLHLQAAYASGGTFVLAEPSVVTLLDPSY